MIKFVAYQKHPRVLLDEKTNCQNTKVPPIEQNDVTMAINDFANDNFRRYCLNMFIGSIVLVINHIYKNSFKTLHLG
jgi:hypothetical protein